MSINSGAIYVRVRDGVTPETVEAQIAGYWRKKGARPDRADPREIEPLTLENGEGKARLGYAVSFEEAGWIAVWDSEVYTADVSLAAALSKRLKTPVCWYAIAGATDAAALRLFGTWPRKQPKDTTDAVLGFLEKQKFPFGFADFGHLPKGRKGRACRLFGFKLVRPEAYDGAVAVELPPKPVEDSDEDKRRYALCHLIVSNDFIGAMKKLPKLAKTPDDALCGLDEAVERVLMWGKRLSDKNLLEAVVGLARRGLGTGTMVEDRARHRHHNPWTLAAIYAVTLEAALRAGDDELRDLVFRRIGRPGDYRKLVEGSTFKPDGLQITLRNAAERLLQDGLAEASAQLRSLADRV